VQVCSLQVSKDSQIFVENDLAQILDSKSSEYVKIDLKQTLENFIERQDSKFELQKITFRYTSGILFNTVFIVNVA
jgi:hypothetical protein